MVVQQEGCGFDWLTSPNNSQLKHCCCSSSAFELNRHIPRDVTISGSLTLKGFTLCLSIFSACQLLNLRQALSVNESKSGPLSGLSTVRLNGVSVLYW